MSEVKKRRQKQKKDAAELPVLNPAAAGIDIGATEIYVAVRPDRDLDPVRLFSAFVSAFVSASGSGLRAPIAGASSGEPHSKSLQPRIADAEGVESDEPDTSTTSSATSPDSPVFALLIRFWRVSGNRRH